MRFPHQILLRGHGQLHPSHPRLPSPRGAAGPRNRGQTRLPSAAVFCLRSRQAAGKTQQNELRKTMRQIWCLKSFENCGHSISSPDLMNSVVLRCLEVIELAEKAMSTTVAVQMIWYHHSLFNLHGPGSFCKKQDISAGCLQTIIRIPPSSQSMAQQNGTKLLQAIACHCIMSLHHQIFKVIKQQHLRGPCPLHLSSARSSRRCE